MRRVLIITLSALLLSGCAEFLAGVGVGAGSYLFYDKGNISYKYNRPFEKVWSSTLAAIAGLGFELVKREKDDFYGSIKARTKEEREIVFIHIKKNDEDSTTVSIWVDWHGDKGQGEAIHDELATVLKSGYNRFDEEAK